jgi:hypothetical protein
MNKKTKQILLYSGLSLTGFLVFILFRNRTIDFYDNVWCADYECSNINVDTYVEQTQQEAQRGFAPLGDQTGFVHLFFTKPHKLQRGEYVYVEQNEPYTFEEYNGWHKISRIVNDNIIELSLPRMGDTPVEGGIVKTRNYFKKEIV